MDRRVKVEQVKEMLKLTRKFGIETGTFIMVGYPGETENDIIESIEYLKHASPDLFTVTITYPIKGTSLYEQIKNKILYEPDWEFGTDREINFKRTYSLKLGFLTTDVPFGAIPIEIIRLANTPILLAIPLFTFAGYLLAQGGTSTRLVKFSRSLFGWIPGGLGVVALVSCAFFTAITGATGITIIALGGLLFPALISDNYSEDFSLGLMTTSGSLGLHFPPSLPIILYGFVSGTSIEELFMAGLLPGTLMVGILCLFSVYMGRKWRMGRPQGLHCPKQRRPLAPVLLPQR